ncbi:hypothetical protein BDV26DRAFT_92416 [Aspergillus bertholletiae]|uniref:FAD-binding FR-type domain-containing protein n=1 Tax=Aspergillus bertholletiae TaxID=1226010 RepID=A0A5N7BPY6_9EURO|nr:hypothetical protein BDV26DRAFT_92416 [Aspergillus bertholletiae]
MRPLSLFRCRQLHKPLPNLNLSHKRRPFVIRHEMSALASKKTSVPHKLRTAAEPRQNILYNVRLSHIEEVNPTIRLLHLTIPPRVQAPEEPNPDDEEPDQLQPFTFAPGQWLDVHIPSISDAGGFSITSTPADAEALPSLQPTAESLAVDDEETGLPPVDPRGRDPYVELAVQKALSNPASAWLWKPKDEILGKELGIRVGGSFIWPPPSKINLERVKNVVLIAGGVGINPLISILSHLNNNADKTPASHHPFTIHFLYSTKFPSQEAAATTSSESVLDQILFLSRLRQIIRSQSQSHRLRITLDLFATNLRDASSPRLREQPDDLNIHPRRINQDDLRTALTGPNGGIQPEETVCYMCGPPAMTDEFVATLQGLMGDGSDRVFFEKWW